MSSTEHTDVSPDTFSARLRDAMKRRKFSAETLSQATKGAISERTIFRWLRGESEPGIGAMTVLCPVLKVSADWLLGLQDRK